jgi:hypothetical protein
MRKRALPAAFGPLLVRFASHPPNRGLTKLLLRITILRNT